MKYFVILLIFSICATVWAGSIGASLDYGYDYTKDRYGLGSTIYYKPSYSTFRPSYVNSNSVNGFKPYYGYGSSYWYGYKPYYENYYPYYNYPAYYPQEYGSGYLYDPYYYGNYKQGIHKVGYDYNDWTVLQ